MNEAVAVVLAAGQGTRMKSDLPKVLVPAGGRPLLDYVLDALDHAGVRRTIVVVGYGADLVRAHLRDRAGISFAEQPQQLGTGHAVMQCVPQLEQHDGAVLVLTGDSPMTQADSLRRLLELFQSERPACILGTLLKDDPRGLGRVLRNKQGDFLGIVEEKDATPLQLEIREVNMSTYVFDCQALLVALQQLDNQNQQGEYYITDCPGMMRNAGLDVRALPVLQACEALSVNNLDDLRTVEAEMRRLGMV